MSVTGRGHVIKAGDLRVAPKRLQWDARSKEAAEHDTQVDVEREEGKVKAITVRCQCGEVHRLDLIEGPEE